MVESETAKALTKLVKQGDKLIQNILKDVAEVKEIVEEIKKLKEK